MIGIVFSVIVALLVIGLAVAVVAGALQMLVGGAQAMIGGLFEELDQMRRAKLEPKPSPKPVPLSAEDRAALELRIPIRTSQDVRDLVRRDPTYLADGRAKLRAEAQRATGGASRLAQ